MQPVIRPIDFKNQFGRARRIRMFRVLGNFGLLTGLATGAGLAATSEDWRRALLRELSQAYLEEEVTPELTEDERRQRLERLFRELGRRLADSGRAAVPVRDIASLALLGSELADPDGPPSKTPMLPRLRRENRSRIPNRKNLSGRGV